jgi:hypothetical protein
MYACGLSTQSAGHYGGPAFPAGALFHADEAPHQPHDQLFRSTFSDPTTGAAFLRHHLGESLSLSVGTLFFMLRARQRTEDTHRELGLFT